MCFYSDEASKILSQEISKIFENRRQWNAPEITSDIQYLNFETNQMKVYKRNFKGAEDEAPPKFYGKICKVVKAYFRSPLGKIIMAYLPKKEDLKAIREVVEVLAKKDEDTEKYFEDEMNKRKGEYVQKKAGAIFEREIGVWNRKRLKNVKKIRILKETRSDERKNLAGVVAIAIGERMREFYSDENIKVLWEETGESEDEEVWSVQF